jgi:hypothetical protein
MNARTASLAALAVLVALAGSAEGQTAPEDGLTPGDVVRVDGDFIGTLMSIEDESTLTVIGEGERRCYPGQAHGEGPRCDPAPSIRRVVDWHGTTVERQLVEVRHTRRTILGAFIGGAALAPIGYLTGPSLGYGKVDACTSAATGGFCPDPITDEELDARQRSRDQLRGALLFGIVGATMGALLARTTADEWIEVHPPSSAGGGGLSFSLRVPTRGRRAPR